MVEGKIGKTGKSARPGGVNQEGVVEMQALQPSSPQPVKNLNYRHEAILVWMIANPHRKLGDCARELGYTQPWLSTIIWSDLFQAEYRKRCNEMGEVAVHTTVGRLSRITEKVLDRIDERLDAQGDERVSDQFLLGTMNSTLEKLGYLPEGQKKSGPLVGNAQNVLIVSKDDLAAARQRMLERVTAENPNGQTPVLVVES